MCCPTLRELSAPAKHKTSWPWTEESRTFQAQEIHCIFDVKVQQVKEAVEKLIKQRNFVFFR